MSVPKWGANFIQNYTQDGFNMSWKQVGDLFPKVGELIRHSSLTEASSLITI